ncbi:MAG: hypothetical protein KC736_01465 [Candidatus Moranbacteria bacterium]|nr:hypothetical protein [Candidatus Moranbacteria bacterium]
MQETNFVISIGALEAFSLLLGIVGPIVIIAWKFAGRLSSIETSIMWLRERSERLDRRLDGHDGDLRAIRGRGSLWSRSNSPLQLTDNGRRLLLDSGMRAIVSEHLDELLELLEAEDNPTAYDVSENAIDVLVQFFSDRPDLDRSVKEYLFHHPELSGTILSMEDVFYVGSLMLRDAYFDRHPDMVESA